MVTNENNNVTPGPWVGLSRAAALETLLSMEATWHPQEDPMRLTPYKSDVIHHLSYEEAEALSPGLIQAVQDFDDRFGLQSNLANMRQYYRRWLKRYWTVTFTLPAFGDKLLHPVHLLRNSDVDIPASLADFYVHVLVSDIDDRDPGRRRWVDYERLRLDKCADAFDTVCPGWQTRLEHAMGLELSFSLLPGYVFGAPECAPSETLPDGMAGLS